MKRLVAILLAVPVCACAAHAPDIRVLPGPDEGCAVVLLERFGGLGFEDKGGVIAAVWRSGTIVRAESVERPWGPHIAGRLEPGVLGELLDAANSDDTWSAPRGQVALDEADDVLTLRRRDERRSWAESPGVTSTPLVGWFRERLTKLRIEQPKRTSQPLARLRECVGAGFLKRLLANRPLQPTSGASVAVE